MADHAQRPPGREERLQRLLETGRSLTAELHLDAVLARILETARQLTGARYAAVGILDENRHELAEFITSGIDAETERAIGDPPRGRGVLGVLIDDPRPIRLHAVGEHPQSYGIPPGHPPMHAFLGAPIMIRGRAWGNIYLTEKEGGEDFDDDDLAAIEVLSGWAAIAINNARLYGESEHRRLELERAVRGMEASAEVALALGAETDLTRILALIAERARVLVEARAVLIMLPEGEELHVAAHAGDVRPPAGAGLSVPDSTTGHVLTSRTPRRVDDLAGASGTPASVVGLDGARSALFEPLVYRGVALGVLSAFDPAGEGTVFDEGDERALRSFAASAATAVAAARTVEEQRLRDSVAAAEAERRRWARELHDATLQGLSAVKLALAASLRAQPPADREAVRTSIEMVDGEIASLREIISDLRPAALDELGLEPALRSLASRIGAREGWTLTMDLDLGHGRLAPDLETVAYRVTQEALTNVAKHAGARRVGLAARREGDVLRLRVTDDGRGIGPQPSGGFGLMGMRERAALAGGRLRVEDAAPGTCVSLTLPVGPRADA